jgi:hypothetical protein
LRVVTAQAVALNRRFARHTAASSGRSLGRERQRTGQSTHNSPNSDRAAHEEDYIAFAGRVARAVALRFAAIPQCGIVERGMDTPQ